MSFKPNIRGPLCPTGELIVAAAGTAIQLSSNWNPNYNPNAPVTDSVPEQYSIRFEDIIINSPSTNLGGLFLVLYDIGGATGSKNTTSSIILYIPKGSGPTSLKKFLGSTKINPNSLAIDADQDGDKAWAVGIV